MGGRGSCRAASVLSSAKTTFSGRPSIRVPTEATAGFAVVQTRAWGVHDVDFYTARPALRHFDGAAPIRKRYQTPA